MAMMKSFTKDCNAGQMCMPAFQTKAPIKEMSLWEYYKAIDDRMVITGERKGQAALNLLATFNHTLARKVQIKQLSPFFVSDRSDPKWKKFVAFIEANWQYQGDANG